jgi:hypothetical protein
MMVAALLMLLADPVQVTPAGFSGAQEPQVAFDGGNVYVAYGMGDTTYLSLSTDRGATYGAPIKVGEAGRLSLGMRRGPRVCARDSVVTVSAVYGAQGKGRDGDLLAFRSVDRGRTWTGPVKVNDVEGSAREGLHAMAVAPDGTLACAWLDLRQKGTTLYLSSSKDGGLTWSKNRLVYTSPSGTICQCCHPSVAFDSAGKMFIMFRNSLDGARDMYLTDSTDLRSLAPAKKLGAGTWLLAACPMDGGMLAVSRAGEIMTVWRRDGSLYRAGGSGAESLVAEGRNPWLASGAAGPYFVWQDGRRICGLAPDGRLSTLSTQGVDPVVAASADGKLVVSAWTDDGIRALRMSP